MNKIHVSQMNTKTIVQNIIYIVSGIFKSKQMADKVRLAKEKFGLQESQILPIASYVQETRQNITKDVLALQAVENILSETLEYVKNQVPGQIQDVACEDDIQLI